MQFLRIDSSIRRSGSVTRALTDTVEVRWRRSAPSASVRRRDLAVLPGLVETWQQAACAGYLPEAAHTEAMRDARATATNLADEVLAADAVTLGAPLYNFGVPTSVKAWLDLLITDPRFDPRRTPVGTALVGRPVLLLTAQGGCYRPGTPRAGWDHATGYLQRMLADVMGATVTVVAAELTAAGHDPALHALRDDAERSHRTAIDAADRAAARHVASLHPMAGAAG